MKAFTIALLLHVWFLGMCHEISWNALRHKGASISIDENKGFWSWVGSVYLSLFADLTPCLALEMKSKRSVKFAIFEHINRQGKEYWGKYDVIWGAHQCIFQRSNWWALCASCRLDGSWARIDHVVACCCIMAVLWLLYEPWSIDW